MKRKGGGGEGGNPRVKSCTSGEGKPPNIQPPILRAEVEI